MEVETEWKEEKNKCDLCKSKRKYQMSSHSLALSHTHTYILFYSLTQVFPLDSAPLSSEQKAVIGKYLVMNVNGVCVGERERGNESV